MKFDNNVKEYVEEESHKCKKYAFAMNGKHNKNASKIGKKGVDSLLEKLESCSNKVNTSSNEESVIINSQIAKRGSPRVKSMSPDCNKSISVRTREDDVISPSLSNDDSNESRQIRKRKLGKPVRLSKESKLIKDDSPMQDTKPQQIMLKPDSKEYFYNLLPAFALQRDSKKEEFTENLDNCEKEKQAKTCNDTKLDLKEENKKHAALNTVEEEHKKTTTEHKQREQSSVHVDMSKYLLDALKSTKLVKSRRSSESAFDTCNEDSEVRRKSCDNFKELLNESVLKTSVTNCTSAFHEVESQLEKMFAGIIEVDKNLSKSSISGPEKPFDVDPENKAAEYQMDQNLATEAVSTQNSNKNKKVKKKNTQKKVLKLHPGSKISGKRKNKKKIESQQMLKKKALKKKKDSMSVNEAVNESAQNSGTTKSKGPIIQIKGFQKTLSNIQIVNTPKEDDEEKNKEKRKISNNGIVGRSGKSNFQSNLDYRGKSSNVGLFNSTLSMRYDAQTADVTWICVFCKRGPHCLVSEIPPIVPKTLCDEEIDSEPQATSPAILSDLFGPYLIDKTCIEDISIDEQEALMLTKTGSKSISRLENSMLDDQLLSKYRKRKTSVNSDTNNLYMGMNKLGDDDERWEVWIHEQCIIWTAGVFITGGRIRGLQAAVWDAAKSMCNTCSLTGANIGCIKRGCKSVSHYCCALASGWHLDTTHFLPKCNGHDDT